MTSEEPVMSEKQTGRRFPRVIQPMLWAGMQKGGPDSPMVCGACPDWEACADLDRCYRASADDYARHPNYMDSGR